MSPLRFTAISSLCVAGSFALVAACGGSTSSDDGDPGTDGGTSSSSSGSSGTTSSSSGASGSTSSSSSSSGTSGSPDAATDSGVDAADAADSADAANAFTGAAAYTATLGPTTKKNAHPNNGDPTKLACLDCHGAGGPGPHWFAGGSIFNNAAGATPLEKIEVRLRDDNGKAVDAHTDALGNFYVTFADATTAGVTFPLHAGVRDATSTSFMTMATPDGNCNSSTCHGGAQGWIHLP